MLTVFIWDGGGSDTNWTTADNWGNNVVPTTNADLIFPVGAPQTTNVNDFASGFQFGSILFEGDNYSVNGNPMVLNGAITNNGAGNSFGIDMQLGATSGGVANTASMFTVSSAIDTAGNTLPLNSSGGTLLVSGGISGSGDLSTSGSGTVALSGDNTYSGQTTVGGNTLAVRHDNALGTADNTVATGTNITNANGEVQLEYGVTVTDERLTSSPEVDLNLYSIGNNVTNTWTGDVDSGGSGGNRNTWLRPLSTNNRLVVDGDIPTQTGFFGYTVFVRGFSSGVAEINGAVQANQFYVFDGTAEVNGSISTNRGPFVDSDLGDRLSGNGSISWADTSSKAEIRGNLNPGTSTDTGILTLNGDTLFQNAATSNFEVELNGTTPGPGGHDQLRVNGSVEVAGDLEVTLVTSFTVVGDTFVIVDNDGTDPITGQFNGLPETGLVEYGGNIFDITYVGGDGNDVMLTTLTTNNFPTADAQNVTTNEETSVNIILTGSDPEFDPITFSIDSGPSHGSLSGSGANRTYTPFSNYAGPDSFVFRVTDDKGGFGTATVSIAVNNTQDPPTQINLSNSSLNENTPTGTTVGTLTTVDLDVGDTLTYALVAGTGDTDNASFTIVGDQLKSLITPDFETKSSYSVRVKSTDAASASVERAFTITINDVNEAPTALSLSPTSVDENVPSGTVVGTFSSTDPDAGDSHTFSLVSGAGDADNGSFTIDGNQLKIAVVPDFETKSSYDIRVRSTDSGNLSVESTFTISINDLLDNQPPSADAGGAYMVDEGSTVLLDGSGSSDPDQPANTLMYEWDLDGDAVFGETGAGALRGDEVGVNPTFSAAGLDGPSSVTVSLLVTDDGDLSDTDTATINIVNVAPMLVLDPVSAINENESAVLAGMYTDPGLPDSHDLVVDWGDPNNSSESTFALPAISTLVVGNTFNSATDSAVLEVVAINQSIGEVGFSVQHQYLDGVPTATSSDDYVISVSVTDHDGQTAPAEIISFGSGANQFQMEFVLIGNPGNVADTTGNPNPAGAVGYSFQIGKFEVSEDMITKANSEGSLGITIDSRGAHKPATSVSWNEAARFVNWLNTSHGLQPAYKFSTQPGDVGYQSNEDISLWVSGDAGFDAANPFRNSLARYTLPSGDEWYKAAYYDATAGTAGTYFDYPTASDTVPIAVASGTTAGTAVYNGFSSGLGSPADVTQAGGLSSYGTMGQGGNVSEWLETELDLVNDSVSSARRRRGGNFFTDFGNLRALDAGSGDGPMGHGDLLGFRVASLGSPSAVMNTTVTVNNISPDFEAGADETLPTGTGAFSRTAIPFTDPGTLDVHIVNVDYDGDLIIDETINVTLGDRTFDLDHTYTASGTYTVSVTVEDDDTGTLTDTFDVTVTLAPPTEVEFSNVSQSATEDVGTLTIVVELSETSSEDVTVPFTLAGTATEGVAADYTITPSPLVITAGASSGVITITVNNDTLDETDETVVVTMGTPTNATLGTPVVHTVTIIDNDEPVVGETLAIIDDHDAAFDAPDFTNYGIATFEQPQGYLGNIHYLRGSSPAGKATWTFSGLPAGYYRVSATWFAHNNRATDSPFRVYNGLDDGGPEDAISRFNQQLAPNDLQDQNVGWEDITRGVLITDGKLTVTLDNVISDSSKYVIADGIRIELNNFEPQIEVRDAIDNIVETSIDLGTTLAGGVAERTITIKNTSSAQLDLGVVSVIGTGFSVTTTADNTVLAPGASTTFEVILDTAKADSYSGTVSIPTVAPNNDPDETTVTFNVTGVIYNTLIIDNRDPSPQFVQNGFTNYGIATFQQPQGYLGNIHYLRGSAPAGTATWTFTGLPDGLYQASATWFPQGNRAIDSPFKVYVGGLKLAEEDLDQQQPPNDFFANAVGWEDIASGVQVTGGTLTVTLDNTIDDTSKYVIADAVRIERVSALVAPEGSPSQKSSAKGQELQPSQLLPIVDAAIDRLVPAGFAADLFNNVVVAVADLPGAVLGLASESTGRIWIDSNAAGHGWNVSGDTRVESQEPEDSDAYSGLSTLDSRLHMDLLTVVMHELGHLAGLEDLGDPAAEDDLMYAWLEAGVRKTSLEASLADEVFSQL